MIGNAENIIKWLFQQDRERLFEVKEYRQKRSLTANAYYWVLVNEIANRLRKSNDEVHLQLLKDYGQSRVMSVLADVPIDRYIKYFEQVGTGEVNGKVFNHYRVFMGSSEMDSREMAILIDGTVQEAQQLGIVTLTPDEIANLRGLKDEEEKKN